MIKEEKKVFAPNATTRLLVESTLETIKKKSDILDLGCGTGFVGLTVAKKTKFKNNYYFSDLSQKAINLCKKNAERNKVKIYAKAGSMYEPWQDKKFDLIIESISAIAKKVAVISPWYKNGIPCDCGEDGAELVNDVLKVTRKFLPSNRIELITNGDHLKIDKLLKLFEFGLTQISVSLYDGPHQIENFKKLKLEAKLSDEQFDLRFRWAKEESYGINITNRAGAINMPELNVKRLNEGIRKKCFYPFYQIMIDYDGAVLLCNHDWHKKLVLDNINEKSILEIWDNEIYKKTRNNLSNALRIDSPCKECDANGTMMGKEYVEEWQNYYEEK